MSAVSERGEQAGSRDVPQQVVRFVMAVKDGVVNDIQKLIREGVPQGRHDLPRVEVGLADGGLWSVVLEVVGSRIKKGTCWAQVVFRSGPDILGVVECDGDRILGVYEARSPVAGLSFLCEVVKGDRGDSTGSVSVAHVAEQEESEVHVTEEKRVDPEPVPETPKKRKGSSTRGIKDTDWIKVMSQCERRIKILRPALQQFVVSALKMSLDERTEAERTFENPKVVTGGS